jgi:hypothetical protein
MCDSGITISYDVPRQGMRNQGVSSGDLLVWTATGSARTASVQRDRAGLQARLRGRAPIPSVAAFAGQPDHVFYGQAPVRGGNGCAVTRYRDDTLVFDLMPNG